MKGPVPEKPPEQPELWLNLVAVGTDAKGVAALCRLYRDFKIATIYMPESPTRIRELAETVAATQLPTFGFAVAGQEERVPHTIPLYTDAGLNASSADTQILLRIAGRSWEWRQDGATGRVLILALPVRIASLTGSPHEPWQSSAAVYYPAEGTVRIVSRNVWLVNRKDF